MRPFSASDLVEIWERGAGGTPVEQALVILAAAYPRASREALAGLTIAQRDAALFYLRERTFGSQFQGVADCPVCQGRLELAFQADDLRALDLLPAEETLLPEAVEGQLPGPAASFRKAGYTVQFRQPTSADLIAVGRLPEAEQARQALLEACLLSIRKGNQAVAVNELPAPVLQASLDRLGRAAALADLTVPAACPACGHRWEILFDIVSYFWSEIGAWAARLLREVHVLASAYGWREADILAMSAWRRQRYLELIGA